MRVSAAARELGIEEADQKVRELDEPWTIFPRNWFGIVLWRVDDVLRASETNQLTYRGRRNPGGGWTVATKAVRGLGS